MSDPNDSTGCVGWCEPLGYSGLLSILLVTSPSKRFNSSKCLTRMTRIIMTDFFRNCPYDSSYPHCSCESLGSQWLLSLKRDHYDSAWLSSIPWVEASNEVSFHEDDSWFLQCSPIKSPFLRGSCLHNSCWSLNNMCQLSNHNGPVVRTVKAHIEFHTLASIELYGHISHHQEAISFQTI